MGLLLSSDPNDRCPYPVYVIGLLHPVPHSALRVREKTNETVTVERFPYRTGYCVRVLRTPYNPYVFDTYVGLRIQNDT